METLKGEYKGECNRTACNNSNAIFYNHSTHKHYCGQCAYEINKWAQDFKVENGHELCVKVEPETMETLYRKEQILKAFKEGKIIQSKDGNKWTDFIPQNQVDKPNLDYGGIDNWRIKGETIKSDNTETVANALHQIQKLQADKAEMLSMLGEMYSKYEKDGHLLNASPSKIKSLIEKHKP